MNTLATLFMYIAAGLVNGSFATPTKHIKKWAFENIWLQHAIWAFVIFPWLMCFFLAPQVFGIYQSIPAPTFWIIAIGGFLFGIGQIASASAIYMVGIGLTFVICIGISTGLGFLLPLIILHRDKVFTPFGLMTMLGVLLAVSGIIMSTRAGSARNKNSNNETVTIKKSVPPYYYCLGVLLAFLAGIFSAGQNLCFSMTGDVQKIAIDAGATTLGSATIMWPGFLACAFVPYVLYMVFLMRKNNSCSNYLLNGTKKYYLFTFLMGLCWYGSLMLYSKASQLGGDLGPIFGWPIFMVIVIIVSNGWGIIHKEWKNSGRKAWCNMILGMLLLTASIVVLGIGSYLGLK